jgi:hypothetical protein
MLPEIAKTSLEVRLDWTPADVGKYARAMAVACANTGHPLTDSVFGIDLSDEDNPATAYLRSSDPAVWRRRAARAVKIGQELRELHAGRIGKGAEHTYSGASSKVWYDHRKQAEAAFLATNVVYNAVTGKATPLAELAKTDFDRASRHYAFLHGIQVLAANADLNWAMLTITLPSEWHPNPATKSKKPHRWNGKSALEGHKVIAEGWNRVRSMLRKQGMVMSGVRTEEPQQDTTPHWHIAFFYRNKQDLAAISRAVLAQFPAGLRIRRSIPTQRKKLRFHVEQYQTLSAFDGKRPHKNARLPAQCQIDVGFKKTGNEEVDAKVQSFASYVFKYVSKNAGVSMGADGEDESRAGAEDVVRHRQTYGFRQLEFFGIPKGAATCWDLLRQINLAEQDPALQCPPGIAALAALAQREKGEGMADYLQALGGLAAAPGVARVGIAAMSKETMSKYRSRGKKIIGLEWNDGTNEEVFVIKSGDNAILKAQAAAAVSVAVGRGDFEQEEAFYDNRIAEQAGLVQLGTVKTVAEKQHNDSVTAAVEASHTVIAAAGSGKTKLLVDRAAYLVAQGVSASKVVLATFTREAAAELKSRLSAMGVNGVQVGTMHSLSARWLGVFCSDFDKLIADATIAGKQDLYLLVDEAQDLSPEQWSWARANAKHIFAVGDPRQAIYQWRGAEPSGIEKQAVLTSVNRDLFNPGGELDLSLNRRSAEAIVVMGNAIAEGHKLAAFDSAKGVGAVTRYKALTVSAEIEHLIEWAKSREGSVAVLTRTNTELARIKSEFMLAGLAHVDVWTVHASKCAEWDNVALACGTRKETEEAKDAAELFYVAATRAKKVFHMTAVGQLPELLSAAVVKLSGRLP